MDLGTGFKYTMIPVAESDGRKWPQCSSLKEIEEAEPAILQPRPVFWDGAELLSPVRDALPRVVARQSG